MVVQALAGRDQGALQARPQPDEGVTYAPKIAPAAAWGFSISKIKELVGYLERKV